MRLGDWEYDTSTGTLTGESESRRLDPVEASVLSHLLEAAPDIISVQDLLAHSWPDVVVGDNVVHRVIARLRKALDDDARHPRYIETVPRRGYRFIDEAAIADQPSSPPTNIQHCIAVLPFANLGADPSGAAFGDGVAEDILNGLVRSSSVKVIARTSSFQFGGQNADVRDVGKQLGASHILEGSVRIAGERLRVTAQLISAADGAHVWSEQFDRELKEVFSVQDEITRAVLGALNLYFAPRSRVPTTVPAAYSAYVEARRHIATMQVDKVFPALDRAVTLDPNYAEAHAEIANGAQGMVWYRSLSTQEMLATIGSHNEKALAIDPGLHLARSAAAALRFGVDRNFQAAIDINHELLLEQTQDPVILMNYAFLLRSLGRFEQLLQVYRLALSLDPAHAMVKRRLAEDLIFCGEVEEGIEITEQCLSVDVAVVHYLVQADLLRGDRDMARDRTEDLDAGWDTPERRLCYRAALAFDDDDHKALNECIKDLEPFAGGRREHLPGAEGMRPLRASIELYRGNLNAALDAFERSFDHSFAYLFYAPGFEFPAHFGAALDRERHREFYAHPRFQKVIHDRGLQAEKLMEIDVPPLPL